MRVPAQFTTLRSCTPATRPHVVRTMNLNWKRPLLYILLPILIFMVFVGFPPPFAPPRATRPAQEISAPAEDERKR